MPRGTHADKAKSALKFWLAFALNTPRWQTSDRMVSSSIMSILEQLGLALGLASLAGVNLYLTVLLTGLAIRLDLLQLATQYQNLDVLAHPIVLAVAGVLFAMEFIADKVPWLDTLWDTVHTFIRPLGGVLLSLQAMGEMPAYMQVISGLVAGGVALTTHGVKASTRLMVNHSPEPVSNVSLSLAEDAAVVGGVALTLLNPVVGLAVFGGLLLVSWMIFPRLLRGARATWKLAWHKLQMPGRRAPFTKPVDLPRHVDATLRDILLYKGGLSEKEVAATIPCLTGRSRGVRGLATNLEGVLVLTHEMKHLYFTATKGLRYRLFRIPIGGLKAEMESKFLSENLLLESTEFRAVLRFPRGNADLVETIAQQLRMAKGALPADEKPEAMGTPEATSKKQPEKAAVPQEKIPVSQEKTIEPEKEATTPPVAAPAVVEPAAAPAAETSIQNTEFRA